MIEQTAALPLAWVEKVFRKLTLTYGRDFIARWEGQEINDVIEDWSEELAGFINWPEAIAWALKNLPEGKPPTVIDFRALCFKAPKPERPQLPEPKADPARVQAAIAKAYATAPEPRQDDRFTGWIKRGLSDLESGVKRSPLVAKMIREAAAAKGIVHA